MKWLKYLFSFKWLFNQRKQEEDSEDVEFDTDELAMILITLKKDGDLIFETGITEFNDNHIPMVASLFYLLNSGKFMHLCVKGIESWIDQHGTNQEFVAQVVNTWKIMVDNDKEPSPVANNTDPLIHPLRALEPDSK